MRRGREENELGVPDNAQGGNKWTARDAQDPTVESQDANVLREPKWI